MTTELNLSAELNNAGFAGGSGKKIERQSISQFPPNGSLSYDHNENGELLEVGKNSDGSPKYKTLSPMSVRFNRYHRDLIEQLGKELGQKPRQVILTAVLKLAESRGIE